MGANKFVSTFAQKMKKHFYFRTEISVRHTVTPMWSKIRHSQVISLSYLT